MPESGQMSANAHQAMFLVAVLSCIALVQASIPVEVHRPQPYKFGYSVKDHQGEQHREEAGNGAGGVVGSYGFTDARGIVRRVNYVADDAGFRAQVKTNEPGTTNQNPAAVQVISDAPYANVAAAPIVAQPAAVVVPTVVKASPVLGLDARYGRLGLGADLRYARYGADGLVNLGYGYGGALGYTGLQGGYDGIVNYGSPLLGGAVRGYDSRFVNLAL
ncbi:cuticle protein 16.8 [Trichonephila clavata]|uniref:Cuticle protein 16.8 n=1 Tax=Trichonephila clavata TaxID=2740835 RepID=A0A8X6HIH8_TRICU|nr:cuticle protein 16.8 [Trichonephila clavata]